MTEAINFQCGKCGVQGLFWGVGGVPLEQLLSQDIFCCFSIDFFFIGRKIGRIKRRLI